eukprot:3592322-Pleurochrysis_carterae.AAC.2
MSDEVLSPRACEGDPQLGRDKWLVHGATNALVSALKQEPDNPLGLRSNKWHDGQNQCDELMAVVAVRRASSTCEVELRRGP